jgi:hypothetical protein
VFSDAASVCLMDEVECIAQELQDWEGFVPFYFPGQAQGYPEAQWTTLRLPSGYPTASPKQLQSLRVAAQARLEPWHSIEKSGEPSDAA